MKKCSYCQWWIQYTTNVSTLSLLGYCSECKIETDISHECDKFKGKTQKWGKMEIPDRNCFKEGKKCTPSCPSYDLGWLYPEDD